MTQPTTILDELGWLDGRRMRRWGPEGAPKVLVLHGGPAAAGSAVGLAQGLAPEFQALEPWQRGASETPLSVAQHIADLDALVDWLADPVKLIGESWGAMLALAYAAAHPAKVQRLGVIACGTFDLESRAEMKRLIDQRVGEAGRAEMVAIEASTLDPAAKQIAKYRVVLRAYDVDCEPPRELGEDEPFDKKAHGESWEDMLRLQAEAVYPQAFTSIGCATALFHGDFDPHPGPMIRDSLRPFIPQLEYFGFANAGHSLDRERGVREAFFARLKAWLLG
ncbi:MAG: alpha/beta hydrolase [Planctomycetes bacterium]|nr:alpha/beta hydrolase [Planctomycetota bacterium]